MGRRKDACPGRENKAYREAWDAYDAEYTVWECEHLLPALEAADALSTLPEGDDERAATIATLGVVEPPAPPEITCVIGDPVWCSRCQRMIRTALEAIGDLAALLESWADGHRGAASGEKIPTRHSSAPSPSPITDTLDELYGALAKVETDWRQFAGHTPRPNRARNGNARQLTLAYLQEQLSEILAHPASVAFGRAALSWQRRLQKMTKSDPVVKPRPGRCPVCGNTNVLRTRDDGMTECRACHKWMYEEEYQRDVIQGMDARVVIDSRIALAETQARKAG